MSQYYWKAESDEHLSATIRSTSFPKCTAGSFDGANCYIGVPSSGTTSFIYYYNFYYTPVSGNQCPYPGSWYDGTNCFLIDIPNSSRPFLWNNGWYVTTYRDKGTG